MRQLHLWIGFMLMSATASSLAESPRYRGDAEIATGTIWQQTTVQAVPASNTTANNAATWQPPNTAPYTSQGANVAEQPRYRPLSTPETVTLPELPKPLNLGNNTQNNNYPTVPNYPAYGAPVDNNYSPSQNLPNNLASQPPANSSTSPYNSSNDPAR